MQPPRRMQTLPKNKREALLKQYAAIVRKTDRLDRKNIEPNLLGVVGEIGSTTTVAKKLHREHKAYNAFVHDAEEEFGDVLWYLTALGQRIGMDVPNECRKQWSASQVRRPRTSSTKRDETLLALAIDAGQLLKVRNQRSALRLQLAITAQTYTQALRACGLDFYAIIRGNLEKVSSRFLEPKRSSLPEFDSPEIADERGSRVTQEEGGRFAVVGRRGESSGREDRRGGAKAHPRAQHFRQRGAAASGHAAPVDCAARPACRDVRQLHGRADRRSNGADERPVERTQGDCRRVEPCDRRGVGEPEQPAPRKRRSNAQRGGAHKMGHIR